MPLQNVKKKLMITGATGFVGSNFIKIYGPHYEIIPISLRKTSIENIDLTGVDIVLHLAALAHQSSIVPFERYYEANTTLTERLAKRSKLAGVKQFVFYSTVKVYGFDGILDDKKFVLNEKTPVKPMDSYGKSKALAEEYLQKLEDEKFKVAIIRPPLIYGEGVKGNMISLIKLVDKIPILPFAYEENQRTIVSIKNLLHMTDLIIKKEARGIYLAQDERSVSIKEIVDSIVEGVGKKRKNIVLPKLIFKILCRYRKNTMIRLYGTLAFEQNSGLKEIDYRPQETTHDGIISMCKWYLKSEK